MSLFVYLLAGRVTEREEAPMGPFSSAWGIRSVASNTCGLEGPVQEGGHLAADGVAVRAELVVDRRVAALGDFRCAEHVDGGLVDVAVVVDEQVVAGAVGQPITPNHERRHLRSAERPIGTELVVAGWVASLGDAGGRQLVDVVLEDASFVIDEEVLPG